MTDILTTLQSQSWFNIVTTVIALFAAIAAVTPTPAPGSVWAKLYAVVDFLALNVLKAKDKGPTVAVPVDPAVK